MRQGLGMKCMRRSAAALVVAIAAATAIGAAAHGGDGGAASSWQDGHNARSRLIAGTAPAGATGVGAGDRLAGLEIELAPGWKTYWRNPGDAGGVPPFVTFEGSGNLASAKLLFPAPRRLVDASGEAIGYKGHVVLPIVVTPVDATRPVELKVRIEYGICREICIPAEAAHAIALPAAGRPLPAPLAAALARVPATRAGADLPDVVARQDKAAAIEIEIGFPKGATGADLFVEAPEGHYVPLPRRLSAPAPGRVRYAIALGSENEAAALKGKALMLTIVSDAASVTLPLRVK